MTQALNLIVHTGGYKASRDQIMNNIAPPPSGAHYPIPHDVFLETVEERLKEANFQVVGEAHALALQGKRYFGILQIATKGLQETDFTTVLGLRNSHDKEFRLGATVGSGVFVCDNLAFHGELVAHRSKNTRFGLRDLPDIVRGLINKLEPAQKKMQAQIASYKTYELTDQMADHMVMDLLRRDLLTSHEVPLVINEWDTPRHPEFEKDGKTAWRLFNAVTETVKGKINKLPRVTIGAHDYFDSVVSVQ